VPLLFRSKAESDAEAISVFLPSCLSGLDTKLNPKQKEAVLAISAPHTDICLSCLDPKLNPKQKEAVLAISAPLSVVLPPILIIGKIILPPHLIN
jgi:hypothetical protein